MAFDFLRREGATDRAIRKHKASGAGSDSREAVSLVLTAVVEAWKNVALEQFGVRLSIDTLNKLRTLIAVDIDPKAARDAKVAKDQQALVDKIVEQLYGMGTIGAPTTPSVDIERILAAQAEQTRQMMTTMMNMMATIAAGRTPATVAPVVAPPPPAVVEPPAADVEVHFNETDV